MSKIVYANKSGKIVDEYGNVLTPPLNWSFLPAGDAGITRKVTSKGDYWRVVFKKGRRTISKGVWADTKLIEDAQKELSAKRSTDDYKKQREYYYKRRDSQQKLYETEFCFEVESYLNFHKKYSDIAKALAILVTKHAIPIGSGTVARTTKIPINQRASKAVIAWMRHQTTAYDNLQIAKIKGERRAVRRKLAEESTKVLGVYRQGKIIPEDCPLKMVLENKLK